MLLFRIHSACQCVSCVWVEAGRVKDPRGSGCRQTLSSFYFAALCGVRPWIYSLYPAERFIMCRCASCRTEDHGGRLTMCRMTCKNYWSISDWVLLQKLLNLVWSREQKAKGRTGGSRAQEKWHIPAEHLREADLIRWTDLSSAGRLVYCFLAFGFLSQPQTQPGCCRGVGVESWVWLTILHLTR